MMAAAIMATAANRSRTNRTMMIPISAPPKHRSQPNAATCFGSRQLQQYVDYERVGWVERQRSPSSFVETMSSTRRRKRRHHGFTRSADRANHRILVRCHHSCSMSSQSFGATTQCVLDRSPIVYGLKVASLVADIVERLPDAALDPAI